MFGNLLSGAQQFLGNAGKAISTGVGNLVTGAQQFLNPGITPARAQVPTTPTPPAFQKPAQTAPIVPSAGQYQAPTAQTPSYASGGGSSYSPQQAASSYASAIAPYQQQISDYLSSRDSDAYYKSALDQTGANKLQGLLGGYESQIADLQDQYQNAPAADINRRADNSTLSAAQRYRLKAVQEEPILKNLQTVQQGYTSTQSGYDRAVQLAQQMAANYGNDTNAGAQRLASNVGNIGSVIQGSIAASQNPGGGVPAGVQTAAQSYAQQNAQQDQIRQLSASIGQEVRNGATLQQMMSKYLSLGLDPDTILSLYNSNVQSVSRGGFGPASESGDTLTKLYGVSPGRVPQS